MQSEFKNESLNDNIVDEWTKHSEDKSTQPKLLADDTTHDLEVKKFVPVNETTEPNFALYDELIESKAGTTSDMRMGNDSC